MCITESVFVSIPISNLHFSYKRRKLAALGANPDHPPISSLSDTRASKKREQWRENRRKYRATGKQARAVLDLTPESFEELPGEEPIPLPLPPPSEPAPLPLFPPSEPVSSPQCSDNSILQHMHCSIKYQLFANLLLLSFIQDSE